MLNVSNPEIFTDAHSIKLTPIVSAEWNQNLFTPPYLTVAGNGTKKTLGTVVGTIADADVAKPNFTTKQFTVSSGSGGISYPISSGLGGYAYKAIFYARTNTNYPVLINTSLSGSNIYQFGSISTEIDSVKWTKIETYIGAEDAINSITYKINASILVANGGSIPSYDVYFTVPEIYETTLFDYKYNSLWPTDSPFKFFRPGESYVKTGNNSISLPSNYRRVATQITSTEPESSGYYGNKYMPINPVCYNPGFAIMKTPESVIMKNGLPTNLMPYQYFISDTSSKILTAIYEKNIYVNKIVIKFNNILTYPTAVNLTINSLPSSTSSIGPFTPNSNGVLTLYWDGSAWTTTQWTSMPVFNDSAVISKYTTINQITVSTTEAQSSAFAGSEYNAIDSESSRMQIIEISPRLEIDISNFVESVSIDKSLDSENSQVPIASLNSNDASIRLSGIPTFIAPGDTIPVFSNQSNYTKTMLKGMLTRNVKFYINFFTEYAFDGIAPATQYPSYNTYIPGGIFYTDSWSEDDANAIDVQLFDSTRYLQSMQTPDYVANRKPIFEVITNILDLAGFTDYDYDSLYNVCNSPSVPLDVAYYYCNSRETTVAQALSEIFLSYQIGAYIDEYGIMKFLSLSEILGVESINANYSSGGVTGTTSVVISESNASIVENMSISGTGFAPNTFVTSVSGTTINFSPATISQVSGKITFGKWINIADSNIVEGGYSFSNKQKPGKISLRYQPPQIKQSASIHNITNPDIKNSPSFILTTSNDVNWTQEQLDSVGFNYLNESMSDTDSKFKLDVNDLLDIFRTYSLNFSGYAAIEDEIVSFKYKEYQITKPSNGDLITVSVKDNLELSSYINQFSKKYSVNFLENKQTSSSSSNSITGGNKTFVLSNATGFYKYQRVKISKQVSTTLSAGISSGNSYLTVSSASNIENGQKIICTGIDENTFVQLQSGTSIYFYPKATGSALSGSQISFISEDEFMIGYVTNISGSSITVRVDTYSGKGTFSNWYIENIPDYDIYVEPTGNITNIDRGCFDTKVSNHTRINSSLSSKALSEATVTSYSSITNNSTNCAIDTTADSITNPSISITTPANKKVIVYPTTERDNGYKTYSTKFRFADDPNNDVAVAGLVFNLNSSLSNLDNAYFVELAKYKDPLDTWDNAKYLISIYTKNSDNTTNTIAYSDITALGNRIVDKFPNVHKYNQSTGDKFVVQLDDYFHLKVAHNQEDASYGNVSENNKSVISVFLNNEEIKNWRVKGIESYNPLGYSSQLFTIPSTVPSTITILLTDLNTEEIKIGDNIYLGYGDDLTKYMFGSVSDIVASGSNWYLDLNVSEKSGSGTYAPWYVFKQFYSKKINNLTGIRSKIELPNTVSAGTIFGSYFSTDMNFVDILLTAPTSNQEDIFRMSELYATQTPLIDASINYLYQERNFLNNAILSKKNTEKTYCMQTKPEVVGINYYDIEYDNPAAVSTDVYPISYLWHYFPGYAYEDQRYRQSLYVYEDALAYSTVLNTGFRGKFMIANNSPHVVFLNKDSDNLNQFTIKLNVWTHEIIAQSAQENIEKIVDQNNMSETIQIDSEWLQSRSAADKMLSAIAASIDPFSKEISLEIFGNPLIQVGDIINLTYNIKGIKNQKCLVRAISQSFDTGLSTTLSLVPVSSGTLFSGPTTYSITYDGNTNSSGSNPVDSNSYLTGNTATILSQGTLLKTGYTFAGWNTAANGTGTSYAAGSNYIIGSSNLTLYAQWSAASYTISYNGNSNTGGSAPSSVTQNYNTTFTVSGAGTLTRTGYTFAGWNTASDGSGTSYAVGSTYTIGSSNATLYAQWAVPAPTISSVSFATEGSSGMSSLSPISGSVDNGYYEISPSGGITFNGTTYTSFYVGTNGYITFGGGSSNATSLSATNPAFDKLMIGAKDIVSSRCFYVASEGNAYTSISSGSTRWRIRFIGYSDAGQSNATHVYEFWGTHANPNIQVLDIGFKPSTGAVTNASSASGTVWSSLGGDTTGWKIVS